MAPLPKPPGHVRRRNADQPNWTRLSEADVPAEVPPFPLPKRLALKAAKEYWTAIWSSPVAGMYDPVDHFGLARACHLHALALAGKAIASELSELRQLEQLYGLSPRARRALQWEIERVAGAGTAEAEQPVDELQKRRTDRRKRLSS